MPQTLWIPLLYPPSPPRITEAEGGTWAETRTTCDTTTPHPPTFVGRLGELFKGKEDHPMGLRREELLGLPLVATTPSLEEFTLLEVEAGWASQRREEGTHSWHGLQPSTDPVGLAPALVFA